MKKHNLKMVLRLVVALAIGVTHIGASAAEGKPNVVLMLADNLGFGDLSVYNGGTRGGFRTPNIDRLASEGMRFTQFLVEPGCTPSRAGLMTGQYSIRSGMSLIITPGGSGGLQPDDVTLGTMFKSAGYSTTYVGKWHLGPETPSQPQNQGFDQWLVGFKGTTDQVIYPAYLDAVKAPEAIKEASTAYILEARGPGETKQVRVYDREYRRQIEGDIASASVEYIKQQARGEKPFFLMVGFTRPHSPNDTADEFTGISGVSVYGDSVMELDARTGEILDAIEDAGIKDNTIVIWVSDNGPAMTGVHALEESHQGDAGPFRGELGDAYEGSVRTAGMIRWPGKIEPGVSNEMISVHDFLPTLAAFTGAKVPSDRPIDGFDQSDWLLGKKENSNRYHLLTFIGDRLMAVRWRQFRIYFAEVLQSDTNPALGGYLGTTRETNGLPRIFNIEADPKERIDAAPLGAGWVLGPAMQVVGEYKATLKDHPNPPGPNMTRH